MSGNSESQSTPMSGSKLPSPEPSPGLTGSKRPCQGEMSEAPDLKRLHAGSSLAGDYCPSVKVEHESYEDPTAVSVQGKDGKSISQSCQESLSGSGLIEMDWRAEEILVPDRMVGLIIGRGGDVISRLQIESGAKIQMAPDSQGMSDR